MAEYTVRVETIVKNLTLEHDELDIFERIELACPLIFNFDFPCWNESYKATLEKKIITRYFKKEICAETVGLWKMFLYDKFNSIMPYYNQLYLSTIKEYDFAKDHSETEVLALTKKDIIANSGTAGSTDTTASTGTNSNSSTVVDCDTPQARLNGGDYASNIQENSGSGTSGINSTITNSSTNTLDSTVDGTQNYTKTVSGNNQAVQDLILKYRDTIINIDNMIVEEFKDMFILAY